MKKKYKGFFIKEFIINEFIGKLKNVTFKF